MKSSVVALLLATACSGASPPPPPEAPAAKAGRAVRLSMGALDAYALEDGHVVVPNDGELLGLGLPPSETAEVLAAAGLARDAIRLDFQGLLVKAGDRVILFDAGTGEATWGDVGRLPRSLALAGVQPDAVTDIFISHAHSDHVGGLVTTAGALAFPAATIHMSAPEWSYFQTAAETDEDKRLVAAITSKVSTFEPGAQLLPVVKAVATPGHTPGHSSYVIGAGPETLFYLGDVAHHSIISVQRPAWSIAVDTDRPAAEAMRQSTLSTLAADHTRVFAGHFPFPGVGHVVAGGQGLMWKPEPR